MDEPEHLSVGEVSRVTGATVRALHHYDDIGLLCPSQRSAGGYREYSAGDIDRLALILVYRSCGVPLPAIAELLESAVGDRLDHLRHQVELIDQRIEDIRGQRDVLVKAMEAQQMGINMNSAEIFEVFGESDPRQYVEEAQARWGSTDAYAESHRRTASYTKEEWLLSKAETEAIVAEFAECLDSGLPAEHPRARAAAEAHRDAITRWFYPCSPQMQVGLAQMYVADPRFAAHYDDVRPGLAKYVHDAIVANAARSPRE